MPAPRGHEDGLASIHCTSPKGNNPMLAAIRKRLAKDEEGFTLIELMVVVLIIAILIAIAVPTFLGARSKAQARQVQSNLRNAFSAEKTAFTDNQAYVAAATVAGDEPSLSFVDAGAGTEYATPKTVTVKAGDVTFEAVVRIDTPGEADYYRNGGIMQYVLRNLRAGS